MTTQANIVGIANLVADRWRKRGANVDRVNRYLGRVDAIRTRIAARDGERLPVLYVTVERGLSPCGVPAKCLDRHTLTTWTGKRIASLEVTGSARGFNGVELTCYAATIEGRRYYGRGLGAGMYLNLRPGKVVR